ncbi:MAG: hypothetical protein WC876_07585 [Candidatus Thermoplasmatota archaeon]|jgi:hypothetical protein
MGFGLPAPLVQRATETFLLGETLPPEWVALRADLHLTGGRARKDVVPLQDGPSTALTTFRQRYCLPKHGNSPHDIVSCIQTAYYERHQRDVARLAAMAARRGQKGVM